MITWKRELIITRELNERGFGNCNIFLESRISIGANEEPNYITNVANVMGEILIETETTISAYCCGELYHTPTTNEKLATCIR